MNETHAKHDRLWKMIDDAQAESDHAKANSIHCDAEQLARHLHEAEPNDAEHCYAIALTYYHRWGEVLQVPRTVDSLILSVLKGSQNVRKANVRTQARPSSAFYS